MNNPKLRFKREDSTDYPEWKDTSLGKIGDVAMCKRILKEQTTENGDVPFFKISTFGGTPDAYISYQLFDDFRQIYRFPQKGAILISAAGTIGKTVRYNGEDAYYQDSNIVWLEHDDSVVDDFLYQFYQQVSWEGLEGSTIKRLYNKNLLETPISLPCLEEQQKIADFLSAVDEVIAQSEAEVQNLEQQKKAAMQKIFSQEVRFKREDGTDYPEWETDELKALFPKIRNGFVGTVSDSFADKETGVRYLEGTNIHNGIISDDVEIYVTRAFHENHLNSQLKTDDIVMVQSGHIGDCAVVGEKYAGSNCHALIIMSNGGHCDSRFYSFYFHCDSGYNKMKMYMQGNTVKHILASDMQTFIVPIPDLEEQQKIADFLSAYDEAISYAKQELDKWKELKKGLLQQMFV